MARIPIALVIHPSWHTHRLAALGVLDAVAAGTPWRVHEHWIDTVTVEDLQACAGVIGGSMATSRLPGLIRLAGRPAVALGLRRGAAQACAAPDDLAMGALAAEHLVAEGYEQFAYLGHAGHPAWTARRTGFTRALAKRGLAPLVHEPLQGQDPAESWLRALPPRTGLFLAWDGLAALVFDLLEQAGRTIGGDVGVLGVDDDPAALAASGGRLSSIPSPWRASGTRAAGILADLLTGQAAPTAPVLLPSPPVIRRASTTLALVEPTPEAVVAWIARHAHRGIDVRDVIRLTGWSRRTVERQVRRATGRSPLDEIRHARRTLAQGLLAVPGADPAQVALQAGYGSLRTMRVALSEGTGGS